jgi:hypothetical protein
MFFEVTEKRISPRGLAAVKVTHLAQSTRIVQKGVHFYFTSSFEANNEERE